MIETKSIEVYEEKEVSQNLVCVWKTINVGQEYKFEPCTTLRV